MLAIQKPIFIYMLERMYSMGKSEHDAGNEIPWRTPEPGNCCNMHLVSAAAGIHPDVGLILRVCADPGCRVLHRHGYEPAAR